MVGFGHQVLLDSIQRLRSKLRDKNWVFLWDALREATYLLAVPPLHERETLRFEVQRQG